MSRNRGRRVLGRGDVGEPVVRAAPEPPRRRHTVLVAVLLSMMVTATMAAALAVSYTPVTPYDEQAHFDYVTRLVEDHRLVHVGEVYSPTTLGEMRCRGVGIDEAVGPRVTCGPPLIPAELPFEGVNYVASYSPMFYAATAVIAGPLSAVSDLSLFEATRLVCVLWFALGAGLLTLALARLGANPVVAAAGTILLASTPAFLLQGGAVTVDSISLMVGAGSLFIVTVRTTWRRRLGWATVFGIVAALVKSSFVPLATFAILMAMVLPVAGRESRSRWLDLGWKRIAGGLCLATLPVLAQSANSLWRATSLAPGTSADGGMNDILPAAQPVATEIVLGGLALMKPLESVIYISTTPWAAIAVLVQTVLLGGGALVAMQPSHPVRGLVRSVAFGAVGAWVLSVIFLPVTFYVLFHVQGTQGRYALPVMPLFLAAVVLTLSQGRRTGLVASGIAAVGCGAALVAVMTV